MTFFDLGKLNIRFFSLGIMYRVILNIKVIPSFHVLSTFFFYFPSLIQSYMSEKNEYVAVPTDEEAAGLPAYAKEKETNVIVVASARKVYRSVI
jgi:hypothetical protein